MKDNNKQIILMTGVKLDDIWEIRTS
jgi:hypothetical protein